jgi:protein phosphatase
MGTTLCGVAMVEYGGAPHWVVFNIGDSRVYRIACGEAVQLTVDHSEVAELVARHEISPDQARTHPLRHVVTRSLGVDPLPPADVWIFPPSAEGDVFLACSDGLTNELSDSQIAAIVTDARSPRDAAAQLVAAAVDAGGRDNVTAVLAVLAPDDVVDELSVTTTPREAWS